MCQRRKNLLACGSFTRAFAAKFVLPERRTRQNMNIRAIGARHHWTVRT